jgi:hypothetical protein
VDDAQAGVSECQSAEQSCERHIAPSRRIISVVKSLPQRARRQWYSLHAESVGHGIGSNRYVGLDQLRKCVEPCVRSNGPWQGQSQLWVNNGEAWEKERAAQARFHLPRGHAQHRIARNL